MCEAVVWPTLVKSRRVLPQRKNTQCDVPPWASLQPIRSHAKRSVRHFSPSIGSLPQHLHFTRAAFPKRHTLSKILYGGSRSVGDGRRCLTAALGFQNCLVHGPAPA